MRTRIRFAMATLGVVPLALGVAVATAASGTGSKAKAATLTCRTSVAIEIPGGSSAITPPVPSGAEYGTATCAKPLGAGVQADHFSISASTADTVGKLTWYFPTGSISVNFDLTPGEGSLGGGFSSSTYTGVYKVTGGTGTLKGASGTGTSNCASPDGVHTGCTLKLKVKL